MIVHSSKIVWLFCWLVLVYAVYSATKIPSNQYAAQLGSEVEFKAVVVNEPETNQAGQTVDLLPINHIQKIRATLYQPGYIHKGDEVWVMGRLELPKNFSDFNYLGYLRRHNIYAVLKSPRVIVVRPAKCEWYCVLRKFRRNVINQTAEKMNQVSSSLTLGMLLGYRDSLPQSVEVAYQRTGLTHILAVSGFNMTIIATSLGVLAWLLGRKTTDLLALVIIFAFVLLTGMTSAVIRAAIMSSLWLVARILGRLSYSYQALLITIAIMCWFNPLLLFYDVGFQLSIVATLGVLAAHQLKSQFEKDGFWVELFWPTAGAILMTLPIIAYHFGTLSLVSPLANALVLPFVPWLMLLSALSLLPGIQVMTIPLLERMIAQEVWVIQRLSDLPFAQIQVTLSWQMVVSYYFFLSLIFWLIYQQNWGQNQLKPAINYGKLKSINL